MQYWKPADGTSVGDPMPFWWDGTFHLFYLIDDGHHSKFHGLGGHIWGHAASRDLIHWEHHPLAVPLGEEGACDQYGICTGSVFHHEGTFYAFYATRTLDKGRLDDPQRQVTERVCLSMSRDCIHFTKSPANPILSPPSGYMRQHFRDPFILRDEETGRFRMLVTACLDQPAAHGRGGCLAQFVSNDLSRWEAAEPFLVPGLVGVPECPDHFYWNGWYYLTFLIGGWTRYRMSREACGPWHRPRVDTIDGPGVNAMKTAPFGPDRRIGVGFRSVRRDNRDDGGYAYAGNAVFREIVQRADATLGARFVKEMVPTTEAPLALMYRGLTGGATVEGPGTVRLTMPDGFALASVDGIPSDARITLRVAPKGPSAHFGLCVRGTGACESGYELRLSPWERRVRLGRLGAGAAVEDFGFDGLDRPFDLDIVMRNDIIDVCVDNQRCLMNRLPELRGSRLFFFCENGDVLFDKIEIAPFVSR